MAVKLDHAGIERILRKDMRGPIEALARQVAANVNVGSVTEAQVTVRSYTTDRAIAVVAIAHPAGAAIQAKHGSLTRAAASQGLTVRSKK
jgi:hypothetical protein